jgi:hypothetical protein
MFEPITCALLQECTTNPSLDETEWYTPWFSILAHLFPISQSYVYTPLRRIAEDNHHTPYLVYEVSKLIAPGVPLKFRTVLIVVVMHDPDWRAGIPLLETEINRQTDIAFSGGVSGTANSKVYWIGVLGPHWRYGVKEDNGQELKPSIDWHDTTHDQASYDDFQQLVALIADM